MAGTAFDPASPPFIADPFPTHARMRVHEPVWYDERTDHWYVSRYADVDALLRDRRHGGTYVHTASHAEMGRPEEPAYLEPFWTTIRNGMLDGEPLDHTAFGGW